MPRAVGVEKSWWGLLVLGAITILLESPADRGVSNWFTSGCCHFWKCLGLGYVLAVVLGAVPLAILGAGISGNKILRAPPAYPCIYFKISR